MNFYEYVLFDSESHESTSVIPSVNQSPIRGRDTRGKIGPRKLQEFSSKRMISEINEEPILELMSKTNNYLTHKRDIAGKPEIINRPPIIFEERTKTHNEHLDIQLFYAHLNKQIPENPDLMKKMMAFS